MYQDHPQFKTLLQCMGAEGGGDHRAASAASPPQPQPASAAAAGPGALTPAAAMLAMLRSPRVLDAFGEVAAEEGEGEGGPGLQRWPSRGLFGVRAPRWRGLLPHCTALWLWVAGRVRVVACAHPTRAPFNACRHAPWARARPLLQLMDVMPST